MSSFATEGVRLERFGFRLRDVSGAREHVILRDVALHLAPGECGLVTGPTGCGKSTLLRAIAGVPPGGGRASGLRSVGGRAALLLQNIETQLLFTLVREEVASGLTEPGIRSDERVRELLARVGLPGFEARNVDALSAGEQQRVALAALLAREPTVLLLDEPTSALDPSGRRRLAALLKTLKSAGHCILVADHVTAPFSGLADRHFRMKEGALCECAPPDGNGLPRSPTLPAPSPAAPLRLRCEGLEVRSADGRALLEGISLALRAGERLLVTGPNGAGKSTLLRTIAGLVPPSAGRLRVDAGAHAGKPGSIGLLFQHPQRNLFERCVADELAFTLRRRAMGAAACARRVAEILSLCALGPLRDRSPLRLSFGEQHRVALAAVLAAEPALLLLDEPFSGLDPETRQRMLELVAREQQRTNMAVLVASHDRAPLDGWVHGCVELAAGDRARA